MKWKSLVHRLRQTLRQHRRPKLLLRVPGTAPRPARPMPEILRISARRVEETAENAKNAAQEAKQSTEDDALAAAQSKKDAEAAKLAAEQARDSAEEKAVEAAGSAGKAEQYSGKPPKPQNGTWWIWNADTGEYYDTKISCELQGPVGNGIKDIQLTSGDHSPAQRMCTPSI